MEEPKLEFILINSKHDYSHFIVFSLVLFSLWSGRTWAPHQQVLKDYSQLYIWRLLPAMLVRPCDAGDETRVGHMKGKDPNFCFIISASPIFYFYLMAIIWSLYVFFLLIWLNDGNFSITQITQYSHSGLIIYWSHFKLFGIKISKPLKFESFKSLSIYELQL